MSDKTRQIMTDHSEFGRLLTEARESHGLSRTALAHEVGLGTVAYRELELGNKSVSLAKFAELHRVLGFDVHTLLHSLDVHVSPGVKRKHKSVVSLRRDFGRYSVFGRQLIRARTDAELTIASLARAVGVAALHITNVEGGNKLPSLILFVKLQRVLDFDAEVLLNSVYERPLSWNEPFGRFGAIVQAARETLGQTLAEVTDAVRCELDEYTQIERGIKLPTMTMLVHLHRALRFDVNTALRTVWSSPRALNRLE